MPRSKSWGFPRWGGYGGETNPETVRPCDREGCAAPGDHPAPKARNSDEKYWFCQHHAGEYNRAWNYFAGMSYEELQNEAREAEAYARARTWDMAESGSAWTREERRALGTLNLTEDASPDEIKTRYRELAKRFHPDANPGDSDAVVKFQAVHQAYDILRRSTTAADRRQKA